MKSGRGFLKPVRGVLETNQEVVLKVRQRNVLEATRSVLKVSLELPEKHSRESSN